MRRGMPIQSLRHAVKVIPALAAVLCCALAGCGCNEEDPTIAIVNKSSGVIVVHVEMSDGASLDSGEVQAGVTTEAQVIPAGLTGLALTWGDIPVPYYTDLLAEFCYDYEITFEGDSARVVPIER